MKTMKYLAGARHVWGSTGEFTHYLVIAGIIASLDQMLKSSIDSEPVENFPRDMPKTKGKVRIMRAHNPGFTRGRFGQFPEAVKLASTAAVAFIAGGLQFLSTFYPGQYKLRKLSMATVLGGALSNTIDRVVNGKVTDYLNIRFGPLKSLIVNIGDLAIYTGGLLYGISLLLPDKEE